MGRYQPLLKITSVTPTPTYLLQGFAGSNSASSTSGSSGAMRFVAHEGIAHPLASTNENAIVAGYLSYRLQRELQIRQGQVIGRTEWPDL